MSQDFARPVSQSKQGDDDKRVGPVNSFWTLLTQSGTTGNAARGGDGCVALVTAAKLSLFLKQPTQLADEQKPIDPQEAQQATEVPTLVEACVHGDFEKAQELVSGGCPVNEADTAGRCALHFSAGSACHALTRLLIEHHAEVNCMASEGSTPLHLAAGLHLIPKLHLKDEDYLHVHEGVEILLKAGADHRIQNRFGCTPLHTALYMASHTVAQQQLPFQTVVPYVTRIIEILIAHGAEVNCKDNDECTPLHYASDSGFVDVIKILLRHGAAVNMTNKEGKTALHYAAAGGNLDVASILYHHGADPNLVNSNGQVALSCIVDPATQAQFAALFAPAGPQAPAPVSQMTPEQPPVVGKKGCCTIL
ncbi:putative Ankyrin repeat [Paratrimastix pyriformis]|uniref:Ankyrin repeat n=1 Tax=Paratrimastix pyriformis TaxID=342808 RepID=A0ABQ8UHX5_9EUKA|nr:putative Ankyrin repeat [Paratrimastix pyriformis]